MLKKMLVFVALSALCASSAHALLVPAEIRSIGTAQEVDTCDTSAGVCNIKVIVTQKGASLKRCIVRVEKPVYVISVKGAPANLDIVWTLDVQGGAKPADYRFDLNTGVDIAGDDNNAEFEDGIVGTGGTKYTVKHKKTGNKKAFNYTVNVSRHVGNDWTLCGIHDPIIINRD